MLLAFNADTRFRKNAMAGDERMVYAAVEASGNQGMPFLPTKCLT
jgi:hypothetical protein